MRFHVDKETLVSLKEIRVLFLATAIYPNVAAIFHNESLGLSLSAYIGVPVERGMGQGSNPSPAAIKKPQSLNGSGVYSLPVQMRFPPYSTPGEIGSFRLTFPARWHQYFFQQYFRWHL